MRFNRRHFFIQAATGASFLTGLSLGNGAIAQTGVQESEVQAAALGYKVDATKVDKTKFPKYAVGQSCGTCALFQGKPGDVSSGCPIFAGKVVVSKGWCSAWTKKA